MLLEVLEVLMTNGVARDLTKGELPCFCCCTKCVILFLPSALSMVFLRGSGRFYLISGHSMQPSCGARRTHCPKH